MLPRKTRHLFTALERALAKARALAAAVFSLVAAVWQMLFSSREKKDAASSSPTSPTSPSSTTSATASTSSSLPPSSDGPLVAFSFAGMLWAYFIGVVAFMQEHYDLPASKIRLSGVSCGTAAAMAIFLDLTPEQAFELGLGWQTLFDSRPLRFWLIRTSEVLRMVLAKYDAFGITDTLLDQKYGRWEGIHLGVTAVRVNWWGRWMPVPSVQHRCLSGFESVKELTYAAMCSSRTLPFFRTPGKFRGAVCVDGAYTASYAVPEEYAACPERVVRIGIINLPGSEKADISPDSNFAFAAYEWCDSGGVEANLARFDKGYRDAAKVSAIMSCMAKGLRWAAPDHVPRPEMVTKDPTLAAAWQQHVESRVRFWEKRLRAHFT